MFAAKCFLNFSFFRALLQLNVDGKGVAVKDRGLHQHQRRYGQTIRSDGSIMLDDAALNCFKACGRALSEARDHIEGDLLVKDSFRHRLERQQVHGLLVEFVHTALSQLGDRLEECAHHILYAIGSLQTQ